MFRTLFRLIPVSLVIAAVGAMFRLPTLVKAGGASAGTA